MGYPERKSYRPEQITGYPERKTIRPENRITQEMAAINLKADNINLSVNNRITNEVAQLNIRADSITAEVSRVERKADSTQTQVSSLSIEVGQISTRVANVDNRLGSAESTIIQQAGQISSKVSQTDYNGNTIASLINQTSTTVDIHASKINLVGAVDVLSDITGQLGTINAGTINGVQINSANINISDNVYIGNVLQLGNHWSDIQPKRIEFGAGTGGVIEHSNDRIDISAKYGLTVNFEPVVLTNVIGGLTLAYNNNQAYPRIYFRNMGVDLGYISLLK